MLVFKRKMLVFKRQILVFKCLSPISNFINHFWHLKISINIARIWILNTKIGILNYKYYRPKKWHFKCQKGAFRFNIMDSWKTSFYLLRRRRPAGKKWWFNYHPSHTPSHTVPPPSPLLTSKSLISTDGVLRFGYLW